MNGSLYNLEQGCYVALIPNFIMNPDDLYMKILEEVEFESRDIKMFGKVIPLPRLTSYHSSSNFAYKYSGIANVPKEYYPWMEEYSFTFREISKNLLCFDGKTLAINAPNSCLINYYRNGNDYIGWHSDDEQKSYITNPIYSVSLGDERIFQLRKKETGAIVEIKLSNGSLLVMYGEELQLKYQHRVPKSKSDRARINLTFRYHG